MKAVDIFNYQCMPEHNQFLTKNKNLNQRYFLIHKAKKMVCRVIVMWSALNRQIEETFFMNTKINSNSKIQDAIYKF